MLRVAGILTPVCRCVQAYVYSPTDATSFRMHLGIGRAHVRDLVNLSTVNKMVTARRTDVALRRATSDMFTLEMESVRPDPTRPEREELRMKVSTHVWCMYRYVCGLTCEGTF